MADGWYRALQLEQDPFAVPGPFFSGGERRKLLQELVQQLHFSAGGVVLLGEQGSGVSTLLEAAVRQLSGIADVLLLGADDLPSTAALWAALGGTTASRSNTAINDADSWLEARRQMHPRDGTALPLVVAVDDAQRLSDEVLRALLRLEQKASTELRLLLGAEPALVPRLAAGGAPRLSLRLPALDGPAIADYVLTRLQAAGYSGERPLDDLQLEVLRQHSGGIPGRIPALLPALLESPPPAVSAQTLRRLPVTHLLGVAGLITAVVIGLLYWGGADSSPAASKSVSLPVQLPADDIEAAPSILARAGTAQPGEGPAAPAADLQPRAGSDTESPRSALPSGSEPRGADLPLPGAAGDTAVPSSRSRSPSAAPKTPAPARLSRQEPKVAADAALSADERALLELPADSYLLQLFAARDSQRVAEFARTAPAELRIYRFETRLADAPWHVAVTGPYPDDSAARQAEKRLPPAMRSAKPWPRPQADIAQAIRALHSIPD